VYIGTALFFFLLMVYLGTLWIGLRFMH